jgi:2-dehydro-3-deoxygluconokinase
MNAPAAIHDDNSMSQDEDETEGKARSPRVVALGESMLRLSTHDRLAHADQLEVHVAGSESNVAVALAQLGWNATWFSTLPSTPPGQRVANELAACGVDVSRVRWVDEGRVGLFFVEFGEAPRSTTVWYDRAGSAAADMAPQDLDPQMLDGADYAIVSGITFGIGRGPRGLAERFVAEARARGAKICADVNFRPRMWAERDAAPAIANLIASANVVVCSAHDAARLWSIEGEAEDVVNLLRDRHAPSADLVVLTVGADGAVASLPDGTLLEQPAYPTTVVDRIGAGDAFMAGLLWGLETRGVGEALRAGVVAASLKCTMRGDHLLITAEEFLEHLDRPSRQVLVR